MPVCDDVSRCPYFQECVSAFVDTNGTYDCRTQEDYFTFRGMVRTSLPACLPAPRFLVLMHRPWAHSDCPITVLGQAVNGYDSTHSTDSQHGWLSSQSRRPLTLHTYTHACHH